MSTFSQAVTPLVVLDPIDDAAFTDEEPLQWVDIFVARVIATRAAGTVCRGDVYLSSALATRVYGAAQLPFADVRPVVIASYGADRLGLQVFLDPQLSGEAARLE